MSASTKNINPWCKVMYRDWLESERIMDMSLAAEGLYHRCLMAQAARGSIPADLRKLARLLQKDHADVAAVWPEIEPHFIRETVDGEERLYNQKQRELLQEAEAKQASYLNAWRKRRGEEAQDESQSDSDSPSESHQNESKIKSSSNQNESIKERERNNALRASASLSYSASASVSESGSEKKVARAREAPPSKLELARSAQAFEEQFWPAWPRQEKKPKAFEAWQRLAPDDALVKRIVAAVERYKQTDRWRQGIVPHAASWLDDERWNDNPADGPSPPTAEPQSAQSSELPPLEVLPPDRWKDVLHDFALGDPDLYETWINPLKPLGHADGTVYIAAPSDIVRNWVNANHRDQLELLLKATVRLITKGDFSHD